MSTEDLYGARMVRMVPKENHKVLSQDQTALNNIQVCFLEMMKFQKNQSQLCLLESVLELHVYF